MLELHTLRQASQYLRGSLYGQIARLRSSFEHRLLRISYYKLLE